MKYKKGQLVEVYGLTKDISVNGERFIVTDSGNADSLVFEIHRNQAGNYYYTGITKNLCKIWIKENNLKAINPDGDEQSDFTFNELMSDLTKSNQLTHNTK